MKNELKMGIACGTILIAGFAAQIGVTHQDNVQLANQMKVQTMAIEQQAMIAKSQLMQQKSVSNRILNDINRQYNAVTEEFKITSIDGAGWVRGEKTQDTGEGIYYAMDTFKSHGAGVVKVGDIVEVTWPHTAYENNDWDNIEKIEKIIK
jgi:hypothetical protein